MTNAAAWPDAASTARWRIDADRFAWQAGRAFSPFMRQHIDMQELWRRALRWLPPEVDGKPPQPLPSICPVTLDELLADQ